MIDKLKNNMKNILIILLSIMLSCVYSTDALAQRTKTKGYDYKAHSQRNSKHAKINAKRFKAAGGDLTKIKCGKRRRSKSRRK
ncbi:MAG: hypothetical protein ACI9EA_001241 [Pseudomonadales bacterium]